MSPAQSPNILLILTDQQRFDTLNSLACSFHSETPSMDQLVSSGMTFENAFCVSPVCSPSRGCLMTGLYPSQTGFTSNESPPINDSIVTIGHRLQQAGYETAYHGKSHLKTPLEHLGFEVAFENSHDESTRIEASRFYRNRDWIRNKRPFFHVVSFLNPHDVYFLDPDKTTPETLPPWANHDDPLAGKPDIQRQRQKQWPQERWQYYRDFYGKLVSRVDREIGLLLEELCFSGFASDTWVIFTSDHGDMAGEHGIPFKGPWMYDGVVRVPLVIVPPQHKYTGNRKLQDRAVNNLPAKCDQLVSHIDLVPTILDLAGIPSDDALPGRSLMPAVRGESTPRNDAVFAEWYSAGKLRTPIRMIRTADWKYVHNLGTTAELYDLKADPGEIENLAGSAQFSQIQAEMESRLKSHIEETGDPYFSLDSDVADEAP